MGIKRTALLLAMLLPMPEAAASDPALLKDLTAALLLLGLPCGQVVSAQRHTDTDHLATCSTGERYRIFVNAQGRLTAQKQ